MATERRVGATTLKTKQERRLELLASTTSFLLSNDNMDGHQVVVAHNGPMAIEMVEQYNPEVVLLDIGLPGMDGYEVARYLRKQIGQERPLLIAITGFGQPPSSSL